MAFSSSVFDGLNAGKTGVTVYGKIQEGDPSSLSIAVEGFIETGNATRFQTEMIGMIANCVEVRTIVIDMGKITYLSSMGIGAFVTILSKAKETGKSLFLCNVPKKIEDLLRQLGFWDMFEKLECSDSAAKTTEGTVFPATVQCVSCGKSLKVGKPGAFRCPACKSSFSVDGSGRVA